MVVKKITPPKNKKVTKLKVINKKISNEINIKKIRSILNAKGKPGPKKVSKNISDNELRLIYKMACAGIQERVILNCLHLSENIMSSDKPNDIKRYGDIILVMELAKMERLTNLSETLYRKALSGDTACLIFALKTQGKEYGWSEKAPEDKDKNVNESLVDLIRDLSKK